MGSHGKNVYISRDCRLTPGNTFVGSNIAIGKECLFLNTRAKVIIKNNVMFAPRVTLVTGNHRTDIVGKYMIDVKEEEKRKTDDQDIVIEDDVWIGVNVTVLKGVTIGEGSIVSAGSVVTKDILPYSIYGGIPAKKIKNRFSKEDLEKHIKILKRSKIN